MANLPKLTRSLIEEALSVRGGNASAAAEDLGISRRWLYRCMEAFQIDPDNYRHHGVAFTVDGVHRSGECAPPAVSTSSVHSEHDVALRPGGAGSKFGSIMRNVGQSIGASVVGAAEDLASEVVKRTTTPPRLRRDQVERLHRGRRQINAAWDADLNVSEVLVRYFDERDFEAWVADQVSRRPENGDKQ